MGGGLRAASYPKGIWEMAQENIVQLPSSLDRLAAAIRGHLADLDKNDQEWIEAQIGLCTKLAEARDSKEFAANIEFGEWCQASGFGKDVLNHQTRAAAIAMGREPDALRKCLAVTERRSLQLIYRHEFDRFTNASKTTRAKKEAPAAPAPAAAKTEPKADRSEAFKRVAKVYDERVINGEDVAPGKLHEITGVSAPVVRQVIAVRQTEQQAAATLQQAKQQAETIVQQAKQQAAATLQDLSRDDMPKAMQARFDQAVRRAEKELRAKIYEEVRAEVQKEFDIYLGRLTEQEVWARQIIEHHNGVISKSLFRMIKACLHPDHNTFSHAAEALREFSALERVLVKPEKAALSGPALPTTAAELMKRRVKVAR